MGKEITYDLQALKDGLGKIDSNIEIFEQAIENELRIKKEYRRMISVLEEKKARDGNSNI